MSSDDRRKVVAPRFNPQRLDTARRRRGWSRVKLAQEIEISSRMIRAYEHEGRHPTVETLDRMVDRLGFPRPFFEADDLEEIPAVGTSFRALSNLTAKERNQATAAGQIATAISAWIDERFTLPEPDVPSFPEVDPETASLAVRQHWGIGEKSVGHMLRMAEVHGVRVFSLPRECDSVDAFSFKLGRVPFMFLNTQKSAERLRMDVAHELAHLVLHWAGKSQGRTEEHEAAQFASAFLMPRASVISHAPRNGTIKDIVAAKHRWRVSAAALTYRMHKVGMLSDWRYRKTFAYLSRRGYRTSEPNPIAPESSDVLEQVYRLLREDGVSRAEMASQLLIPPAELSSLTFGLEAMPEDPAATAAAKPAWEGELAATHAAIDRRRRFRAV